MFLYDIYIYIDTDIFIFLLINYFTPFFLTLESCSLGLINIEKLQVSLGIETRHRNANECPQDTL